MKLYNTLTKQIEEVNTDQPTIYTCGPTVYDYPHIGNWFTFIRYDLLIRALKAGGTTPKWVLNITDVGHLVSDADDGEDKLEKGARREGKSAWDVANFYTDYFLKGLERLNISKPNHLPKATDHIAEQIEFIKKLEDKGFTYHIDDGVYYDTAKFPRYADFARLDLDEQQGGGRVEQNPQKRNPADFALWKFSPKDHQRDMEWWAPWQKPGEENNEIHPVGLSSRDLQVTARQGAAEQRTEAYSQYNDGVAEAETQSGVASASRIDGSAGKQDGTVQGSWGFPGWHIECSAMALKYLGETIDVHCGGIDHVPVHHTNEIAQSEAVTDKPLAKVWMHTNHILINEQKISKSEGNGITLEDIERKGIFDAEAFRLLVLKSHYRSQSAFSEDLLLAAYVDLLELRKLAQLQHQPNIIQNYGPRLVKADIDSYKDELVVAMLNDLDTPVFLRKLYSLDGLIRRDGLRDEEAFDAFKDLVETIDNLTGLKLSSQQNISQEQMDLLEQQDKLWKEAQQEHKDFSEADRLRSELRHKHNLVISNYNESGPLWARFQD